MIQIKELIKKYGDRTIIDKLSFDFSDGESYIISGSSGTGKTTLLEILAGIDKDISGEVTNVKSSIAFQGGNLLPRLTVLQNLMLAANTGADKEKAIRLLNELGLNCTDKLPAELSGGMKVKAGIARALMKDAELYLFDEPFSGLDSGSIALTAEVIKEHTAGKTVIYVIHDSIDSSMIEAVRLKASGTPFSSLEEV